MSKPTFVLLHGAWHTPKCWTLLTTHLTKAGYEAIAPALPSSGSNPPTPDWSADISLIRNTVSDLVDQGRDVVVVMHSFSGMTGGTALQGLGKEERLQEGKSGGVVRLVYVVAFLVPEGFQHSPRGTRDNMVAEMETDFEVCILRFGCLDRANSTAPNPGRNHNHQSLQCKENVLPGPRRRYRRVASAGSPAPKSRCVLVHNYTCCLAPHTHHLRSLHERRADYRRGGAVSH
jgi:pimeloyl-ACP methyl ester carboxylesterase